MVLGKRPVRLPSPVESCTPRSSWRNICPNKRLPSALGLPSPPPHRGPVLAYHAQGLVRPYPWPPPPAARNPFPNSLLSRDPTRRERTGSETTSQPAGEEKGAGRRSSGLGEAHQRGGHHVPRLHPSAAPGREPGRRPASRPGDRTLAPGTGSARGSGSVSARKGWTRGARAKAQSPERRGEGGAA